MALKVSRDPSLEEQLEQFVSSKDLAPRTASEHLIMRGMIIELALMSMGPGPAESARVIPVLLGAIRGSSPDDTDFRPLLPLCVFGKRREGDRSDADLLMRAHLYLEQHFQRQLTTPVVARALGVSTRSLNVAFRRVAGVSPHRCLQYVRLREALRLLSSTDLKVEVVAFQVGWRSKRHLYRVLFNATELRPRDLRRLPFSTCLALLSTSKLARRHAAAALADLTPDRSEMTPIGDCTCDTVPLQHRQSLETDSTANKECIDETSACIADDGALARDVRRWL